MKVFIVAPVLAAVFLLWLPALVEAAPCAPLVHQRLRLPEQTVPAEIACDLALDPGEVITASLVLSGSAASNSTIDCHGAELKRISRRTPTILIRSVQRPDGQWDVPTGIRIRNCTIVGDIDIRGLGRNGEAEEVRRSSLAIGHTQRAQAAAPRDIELSGITFLADGDIPLYAAPGVTGLLLEHSRFTGRSRSTAIYLDAESARNRIIGNVFRIRASQREMIAVDGSADNLIEGNEFENPLTGGIFLYRNCGEGGTIRHQAPQRNVIRGNTFRYTNFWAARPAIWLGSRQGNRFYCLFRPDLPLGSSLNPRDEARYNTVTGNRLPGGTPALIVDSDEHNIVSDNF